MGLIEELEKFERDAAAGVYMDKIQEEIIEYILAGDMLTPEQKKVFLEKVRQLK